ncbi:hypothetical protein GFL85_10590 [Rhizobium laguerreae]|uniref:hypothetical protein n=1 Tax=Rhizobium laguerreae TaxID=1076926 RepID=UPI00143FB3D3|nr:hypothetical protein [Rhizobium laguerreae]NKM11479.1 hypothetical protein [Rhizobium laguerreae]
MSIDFQYYSLLVNVWLLTYMATLDELETRGDLTKVTVRLTFPDVTRRSLYVSPQVRDWIQKDLFELAAFEQSNIAPRMQAFALFKMFISGEALSEGEMFRLMLPLESDIYELKSPDLRFFGWFYRPAVFIAVAADTMERVHTVAGLSSGYVKAVSLARDKMDLDPPKYIEGASVSHVFSV